MKQVGYVLGAALAVALAVVLVRALRITSRQVDVAPAAPLAIDAAAAAVRLGEAIRFRTIAEVDGGAPATGEFRALHAWLADRFPHAHAALEREAVNEHGVLYRWPGRSDASPLLLLAHLDVVPVEPQTEGSWTEPPFAGVVRDGYVWGRGALDDKGSALAIMEAIEHLTRAAVRPEHTVYLAFGHDEEIGGQRGAAELAARLHARGVQPAFVLDEGGWILEGVVAGVAAPVASICVAEKGYASVELLATAAGGHSSMPPAQTAIGHLSGAIAALEREQMRPNIAATLGDSLAFIGGEMPLAQRALLANLWLFGPILEWQLGSAPATNALIRTTTAPTIIAGGVQDNVLPTSARAVVNFRIIPGDTVAAVLDHVRRVVADPTIAVRALDGAHDPSAVSPALGDAAFTRLAATVRATFPGTVVTPFITLGATDARHYESLSGHVYRFVPAHLQAADLARIHGIDERIAVADFAGMIRFYVALMGGEPTVTDAAPAGAAGAACSSEAGCGSK
jgi:carboxypeptidase PM20D1